MLTSSCIEIGYIAKAHGLTGELKAVMDVDSLDDFVDTPVLYLALDGGSLTPYAVEVFHIANDTQVLLTLSGVEDRMEAEALVGQKLYFPKEDLPPLSGGHFYYFQVIGFRVKDKRLGLLGTIQDFASGGSAHEIMIMQYQDHEVLIPMVDEMVGLADFEQKLVHTQLPEGLVEMYLGQDEDED